jgi:hypothetical protein
MGNTFNGTEAKLEFEKLTQDELDQLQVMQVKNLDSDQLSNLLDFEAEFYKQKISETQPKNQDDNFHILMYNALETQKLIKEIKLSVNEFSTFEHYSYKELIFEKIETSIKFLVENVDKTKLKSDSLLEVLESSKFKPNQKNYLSFIEFFNEYETTRIFCQNSEKYIQFEHLE